ncbi:hypothetical protein WJ0W_006542 [Paenibacillus melissococcoides]|uniref:Uncharacterized protein n=1 Tax=Paenibacillus melissococcoides TaxID=2912268 RepID=A0ABM9GBA0_9BACL|nr:hypothetical protein [Paenibacillus melissococcoides]CAH8249356.1 hypothetical protein WJ0W_006542 [Paenibacillus melissococcoides]
MAQLDKSLNGWLENALRQLHTATIGRVAAYDKERRRATVQPLIMQKMMGNQPSPHALLTDVPVLCQRFEVDGVEKDYVPVFTAGGCSFADMRRACHGSESEWSHGIP